MLGLLFPTISRYEESAPAMSTPPPNNYVDLRKTISERYSELSKRLQQIAQFALDYPTAIALETIATIAKNADVQPSALIRFAKAFGYGGFSDMQKVFQANVARQSASYKERIQHDHDGGSQSEPESPFELLEQYCAANIVAIQHLKDGIAPKSLDKAIKLLRSAQSIYVMGQRRSFPVATYLSYALSRVDCRVHLLDGSGGLLLDQANAMSEKDVLIVTTFHTYSPDTANVASIANNRKIPYICITDSALSPVASKAEVCFAIHDAEVHSFRSLAASMCVAQTLATGVVFGDSYKSAKRKSPKSG